MVQTPQKYKTLFWICVLLLLMNVLAKKVVIEEQERQISSLQKATAAMRTRPEKIKKAETRTDVKQRQIRQILGSVPEESLLTLYISQMRSLVDKNQLTLTRPLVFTAQKQGRLKLLKYSTRIEVSGDYPQIKGLIADIQNMDGLSHIDSADFKRDPKKERLIRMTLGVSIYFSRERV